MTRRRDLVNLLAAGVLQAVAPLARAQGQAGRPIHLVVGFAPGAQSDLTARLVAQAMAPLLGVPVVVENRPGASGTIAAEMVARAAPDGATVLLGGTSNLSIAPAFDDKLRYDPLRDFVVVGRVARIPWAIAVNAKLPITTVRQLVQYAKARPGQVTYASGALATHLAVRMLAVEVAFDVVQVPYRGTAPAVLDVAAGRVDFTIADIAAMEPHVRAANLRMIATTGRARAKAVPDLPTVAEEGVAGFATDSWNALTVPRDTPVDVVRRLRQALAQALASTELREGLDRLGFEPIDEPADALPESLRAEIESYRTLIRRTGMRAEM
jgi:tripartite-type tricarboxylate transporter receptor subunit TctC